MGHEHALVWTCSYCEARAIQEGPRALALPPIPPSGWIRVDVSRFHEVPASKERKKSEELQTVRKDACPACRPAIEGVVFRGNREEAQP